MKWHPLPPRSRAARDTRGEGRANGCQPLTAEELSSPPMKSLLLISSPFTRTLSFSICTLFLLSSCAVWERYEKSDGVVDFALNGSRFDLPNRTKSTSTPSGSIDSIYVRERNGVVTVSGEVRHGRILDATMGSHVEIMVISSHGAILDDETANFLPRDIPAGVRGTSPTSHFVARLAKRPPVDATVEVVFHEG